MENGAKVYPAVQPPFVNLKVDLEHPAAERRRTLLIVGLLVGIVLLGFGLRMFRLGGQSMWSDEGLSVYRAKLELPDLLSNIIWVDGVPTHDTTPPLYFLLLAGMRLLAGDSIESLRFVSVLFGTVAIPLVYRLGRELFSVRVGLLAALLLSVSPFHVYYSQEVRNYALALALSLASVSLLWKIFHASRRRTVRLLVAWLVVNAALVYTHYFGLFIVAFECSTLLLIAPRVWRMWWLYAALVLVGLAVVPLAPFGLSQLRAGPQFDFVRLPVITVLHQALSAYSLGIVPELIRPWPVLIPYLALAALGIGLWWLRRAYRIAVLYVLAYGLIPLALLLALSQVTPLYNGPRHVLLGLPPLLLLLACALAGLQGLQGRLAWLAPLALVLVLAPQALRLREQFFAPTMVKDDVRGAAEYLNERVRADDVVVLHDAIIRPTFEYYYHGPAPVISAPAYSSLDVDRAKAELQRLADTHNRVWFLRDPAPRDGFPQRSLPTWIESHFRTFPMVRFHKLWLKVAVLEFSAAPLVRDDLPGDAIPLRIDWQSGISLRGYTWPAGEPDLGEPLCLSWYWTLSRPLASAPRLALAFVDQAGQTWWQTHEVLDSQVKMQDWPVGRVVVQDVCWDLPSSLAPIAYTLSLRLSEPGSNQPLAVLRAVDPLGWIPGPRLTLHRSMRADPTPESSRQQLALAHFPVLDLIDYQGPADPPHPGQPWNGRLYWQVRERPPMEIRVRIALSDGAGHSFGETLVPASLAGFPTSAWQVGDLIQTPFRLDLPASMNAGKYHLRVGLLGPDDLPLPSWVGWPLSGPDTVDFGEADVVDWPLVTELPPGIHPFEAEFGVSIRLRGFELAPNPVRLGSTLALTLTWQAVTRPLASYKVFVHFVDAAGQLVSQVDHIPVNGTRATDGWRPGEVVIDRYEIPVPANLPAGSYRLMIGLYRLEDNTRLPALLAGQRQADDRLDLDQVIQIE